ncbi:MAG: type IV toxin-antitoxin system AbiEi family antitoxin domain-containing protein [Myxococcota bacterium]
MSSEETHRVRLLRLASARPIRPRDLAVAGIPRVYLKRLCDRGELEQVDRGLYQLAGQDVSELHTLAQVAVRVPHGVICLLSALQAHELTTELPHAVWVMIAKSSWTPKVNSPKLEIVRASGAAWTYGVVEREIDGVTVKLTTPTKTVADCFRYRRHVGLEVALQALRDYLGKRVGTVDELLEAAKADRVYRLMKPYMEAMV